MCQRLNVGIDEVIDEVVARSKFKTETDKIVALCCLTDWISLHQSE